MPLIGWR
jgi:hypothetical protein